MGKYRTPTQTAIPLAIVYQTLLDSVTSSRLESAKVGGSFSCRCREGRVLHAGIVPVAIKIQVPL